MTPPNGPGPVQDERQAPGARTSAAERSISLYLVPFVIGVLVTVLLWLVSQYNFALYHTTVEFATIAISLAIFLLVWNSRKIIDNNYLLFIGVTFIFIAGLDFLHTLVYQGVGIFPYRRRRPVDTVLDRRTVYAGGHPSCSAALPPEKVKT